MAPRFNNGTKKYRIYVVAGLILTVTALHFLTLKEETLLHVLYRQFYFLPIILGGFWFGLRGGITTSLIITIVYAPFVLMKPSGFVGHDIGNLLEILLFNIVGVLVGWLRNREILHQEERRRAESLASMGKAISCVAHDMKTPLIAIGGFAQQIKRKLSPNDASQRKIDIILQQTERLESMVKDMLDFAKPLKLNLQEGNLNEFIQETTCIAEEKARIHDVTILLNLEKNIPVFPYDTHRLQQALLNLLNNGIEASVPGDEIRVSSRLEAKRVYIEVEDCGTGVPLEKVGEILQPFVSSKKEGTGLGLPIVQKIVVAHGGYLHFQNQEKKGMLFQIVLPTRNSVII